VLKNELPATLAVLRPLAAELGARVLHEEGLSKVSVVGTGMRTHTGVAERMFAALAAEALNLKMITTGDIKISVLVDKADGVRALRAVHQAFGLHLPRPGAGAAAEAADAAGFRPRPGALVEDPTAGQDPAVLSHRLTSMEDIVVSDVLLHSDEGRITIFNLPNQPGNCSRVFQAVAAAGIVVDMIVQNLTAEGRAELSFSVPLDGLSRALGLTQEAVRAIDPDARVAADREIAKVIVLGVGMRTHTGVARRMFGALAQRGINISMINTSEVRVSVVVDRSRGEEALACLREVFHMPP
jgi:aspartate kinase